MNKHMGLLDSGKDVGFDFWQIEKLLGGFK